LKIRVPKFKAPNEFEVKHTHASVVLGSYPLPAKMENAVELGCGNGVASVVMALLNEGIKIKAVDVDETACKTASSFVKVNNLSERIDVLKSDVVELTKLIKHESADFVFFNPPFHIAGKVSKDERRFLERNEDVFEKFASSAFKILKNRGYFRVITSPDNTLNYTEILCKKGLMPKALVPIYGKKGSDSKLLLIEGIKNGKKMGLKIKPPLFLNSDMI
jgi:tRNA1(Val) A37 N6-methylase TrmN6